MGKKIIVLNGSPRKNGNTSCLIDAFTSGAQEAGHTVKRFDLQWMNISPCLGCLKGGSGKDGPCVQIDGMNEIYPAYIEADVFVFASPLYSWSFSAQFKMAWDRLFAIVEAKSMKTRYKECVMLIAAEEDSERNFAPMVYYYNVLAKNMGWEDRGMVLAGGVNEVGDIAGKPSLDDARKLGSQL